MPKIESLEPAWKPRRYWMVHCPEGLPPKKMHETGTDAHEEAIRLAEKEPGKVFSVLEVIESYWQRPQVQSVNWRE